MSEEPIGIAGTAHLRAGGVSVVIDAPPGAMPVSSSFSRSSRRRRETTRLGGEPRIERAGVKRDA